MPTASRSDNTLGSWVAWLGWLGLGVALSLLVPSFNEVYSSMYADWHTHSNILVRAFHWPGYVWAAASVVPAGLFFFLARVLRGKPAKLARCVSLFLLGLVLVISFDWLSGFTFCHEWGCSSPLRYLFFLRP